VDDLQLILQVSLLWDLKKHLLVLPKILILANKWAKQYDYPFEDSQRLESVAQFLAIEQGDESVPKYMLSKILREKNPPDFALEQFRNMPYAVLANVPFPIYITTNYDHFMESSY
jgi:hypothetical protein